MGFGFGPGADLNRTVNQQRSTRRKKSFKDNSEESHIKREQKGLKFAANASEEQLREIRETLQKENKQNRLIWIVLIVIGVLSFILIV